MSETKTPPILCILTPSSDATMKQFTTATKGCLPPTVHVVGIKTAVDLAVKSKPPLIPAPQPDHFSLSGDLLSLVVTNWVSAQGKKPPPRQAQRKAPRRGKVPQDSKPTTPQPPEKPEPTIALVTDFPRTPQQVQSLLSSAFPALCWIMLEGPPEPEKKGAPVQPVCDWKAEFGRDIPFFSYNFAEGNPEELMAKMIGDIYATRNAFDAYRKEFEDVRFVDIPKFPPEPLAIPQFVPEKTGKGSQKGAPPPPPPLPVDAQEALKAAYQRAVLAQLDECLLKAAVPSFSSHFQHAAELLPGYALPAELALVLSHVAEKRAPELFTMRSAAFRTGIPYQAIFDVMMLEKFEELLGFSVGERRHIEQIPLDFVPNVLVPLVGEYAKFKWTDFAGVTLLAFYHEIPEKRPIAEIEEAFKLPLFTGFGKWIEGQEPFPGKVEEKEPQTEAAVSVGGHDVFCGFDEGESIAKSNHYFCESGLRVDTYPAIISNGIVESLSFLVNYHNISQFSFQISQKSIPPANPEEEEEEETIETSMKIRGILERGCEWFMDYSPGKKSFVVLTNNTRIEFDVTQDRLVITGAPDESHRMITKSGDLVRYTDHPVIYKQDGTIEHYIKGVWHMTDKDGKAYLKKDGQWFLDPEHDLSAETFETYFTSRKVVKRSDGLSFIHDDDDVTICFPDGTKFANKDKVWSQSGLPDIRVDPDKVTIESKRFTASFDLEHTCTVALKNEECSVTYRESISNIMITYGQSKGALTMVDLVNGAVANVGTKRYVYYLNDEWQWAIGKQLCSKKDIIQHFEDGDFQERLEHVDEVEPADIESIMFKGQRPRLFVVERNQNAMTVKELLAAPVFQAVMERSTTRVANKDDAYVTLWFDTEPNSYREIRITPKITDDQKKQVIDEMVNEREIEERRKSILASVGDPKWHEIEEEQKREQENVLKYIEKYRNQDAASTASSEHEQHGASNDSEVHKEEEAHEEEERHEEEETTQSPSEHNV